MSDTTQDNAPTQNDETVAPSAPSSTNDKDTFSKEDLTSAVEKARQQEKDKLYQRLQEMEASRTTLDQKLSDASKSLELLMKERDEAQKALEAKAQEDMSAEEKVAQRLKTLEEKEAQLQAQLERVAEEAAKRVRDSELKLYRANKIAESGLTLVELVRGDSEQEIDQSIRMAKEREEAIFSKAREKARAELSSQLPKASPMPAEQPKNQPFIDPSKKYELANLSQEDFNRLKSELLAKARGAL